MLQELEAQTILSVTLKLGVIKTAESLYMYMYFNVQTS